MDYNIQGLKIAKKYLINPYSKVRFIEYKTFLCKISVATDFLGTQICYNGSFFGGSFPNLEDAVKYLRENKEDAIRFFRKRYVEHFKYYFRWRFYRYLYWKIRHHFNPNFYLH